MRFPNNNNLQQGFKVTSIIRIRGVKRNEARGRDSSTPLALAYVRGI